MLYSYWINNTAKTTINVLSFEKIDILLQCLKSILESRND